MFTKPISLDNSMADDHENPGRFTHFLSFLSTSTLLTIEIMSAKRPIKDVFWTTCLDEQEPRRLQSKKPSL